MVRVIRVVLEDQRLLLNDGVALLADVLAQAAGFLPVVARTTQVSGTPRGEGVTTLEAQQEHSSSNSKFKLRNDPQKMCISIFISILPSGIFDEAHVCEHSLANVTAEAVGMPAVVHGLDDTANDELP